MLFVPIVPIGKLEFLIRKNIARAGLFFQLPRWQNPGMLARMNANFQEWWSKPFSKILSLVLGIHLILLVLSGFFLYPVIFPPDYVKINGNRYTIASIQSEEPNLGIRFQKEYQTITQNLFREFVDKKLLEIAAKEKNTDIDSVLLIGYAPRKITEEEIESLYSQYKDQLKNSSKEEAKARIVQFLEGQDRSNYQRNQYATIVQKYKVELNFKEIPDLRMEVDEAGNPALGVDAKNARITVVEFSDFECPFCQRSQEVSRRLREAYNGKIRWVFRDFPLEFHQNAVPAHVAANCSISQGKYWEVFQKFFENTGNLTKARIRDVVQSVGMDMAKFEACTSDQEKIVTEIRKDIQDGKKLGVSGTPAFFINGIFVSGAQPYEEFEQIIEKELKAKN